MDGGKRRRRKTVHKRRGHKTVHKRRGHKTRRQSLFSIPEKNHIIILMSFILITIMMNTSIHLLIHNYKKRFLKIIILFLSFNLFQKI